MNKTCENNIEIIEGMFDLENIRKNDIVKIINNECLIDCFVTNVYDLEFIVQVKENEYKIKENEIITYYIYTGRYIYKCESFVVTNKIKNEQQLIMLSAPCCLEKEDRRKYDRIPKLLECEIVKLEESKSLNIEKYFENTVIREGILVDISEGGLQLSCDFTFEINETVVVRTPQLGDMYYYGKVKWINFNTNINTYHIAIEFLKK